MHQGTHNSAYRSLRNSSVSPKSFANLPYASKISLRSCFHIWLNALKQRATICSLRGVIQLTIQKEEVASPAELASQSCLFPAVLLQPRRQRGHRQLGQRHSPPHARAALRQRVWRRSGLGDRSESWSCHSEIPSPRSSGMAAFPGR